MNGKLYIKKFIRDDGETLSFDAEEIYLSENNTLLVRSDPATTAVEFTEEDGGEMIRQRGATYSQPVSGLIVPKSTEYWALCVRLSRFFILNHTYKIVYIKRDGSMFSMNRAWINAGLQIVPVPYENYSTWTIEFRIGDNFWTEYAEDSQGKEIYSNSVELPLLTAGTGGEVWSDVTQQALSGIGNYFTIDGTSISASINKLEVRGDTLQQTYSGIQLLTGDGYATPSSQTTYWQLSADTSNENLGNAWGRWTNAQNAQWVNIFSTMPTGISGGAYKPDTKYTILVEWANAQNVGSMNISQETASVNAFVGGNISVTDIGSHPNGSQKFVLTTKPTITQGMYALRSFITKNTAADTAKIDLRVTIVEGDYSSTNLSWQPFVGGTPSPNPDYPQDVQVVTGEQTVTVSGKNLFDKNTAVLYNGYFSAGGSIAGDNFSDLTRGTDRFFYIPCEPNTTYSITKPLQSTTSYNRFRVGTQSVLNITNGATLNDYWRMSDGGTTTAYTITTGANANYLFVYFAKATTATNPGGEVQEVLDGLQIEKGSTATDYEPYQGQSYKINLGKNIWSSSMEVGGISANGTNLSNGKRVRSTTKVVVRPGTTYTLSATPRDSGKVINVAIQGWTSDGTFLSQITGADWRTLPLTFTTPANCYKVTLNGRYSDDTVFGTVGESTDAFQNIQLEAGANATEYAPHFAPIELCKIGDYQDYIYKSSSDWFIHKDCGKIAFNSSTGWAKHSTTQGNVFTLASTGLVGYAYGSGQIAPALMDTDRAIALGSMADNAYGVFGINNGGQLRAFRGNYDSSYTAAVFKSEMIGHYVYGALIQPTNTKITDTTLVAQLNALSEAQAYSGKTVYQTNSTTMPAILSVELLQSVGGGETWDNVGAVWEEGVGGVQTINVETTQTTYPVWTVTGPCSNPTLQNDTTDTIASFDGMIASGQTLTVNFADNTAYLDSAPVAKYVSGYVSLAPGENVIGFNSDGGSTQTSTISWDNIIN